jgi:hypothetical protein
MKTTIAVGAALTALALSAGVAQAGPKVEASDVQWALDNGAQVCANIATDPTVNGVTDEVVRLMTEEDLSPYHAGVVAMGSVMFHCPEHRPLLDEWSDLAASGDLQL